MVILCQRPASKGGEHSTKEEIALELTKLCAPNVLKAARYQSKENYADAIAEAYNEIYENLKITNK